MSSVNVNEYNELLSKELASLLKKSKRTVPTKKQFRKALNRSRRKYFKLQRKKKKEKKTKIPSNILFVRVEYRLKVEVRDRNKSTEFITEVAQDFSIKESPNLSTEEQVLRKLNQEYPQEESSQVKYLADNPIIKIDVLSQQQMLQKVPKVVKDKKEFLKNIFMFDVIRSCSYHDIKSDPINNTESKMCVYEAIKKLYNFSYKEQNKIYNEYLENNNELSVGLEDGVSISYKKQNQMYNNEPRVGLEDGVSNAMIEYLCQKKDIPCYGVYPLEYNREHSLVARHKSKSRNRRALVYYCMNEHMYVITDKKERKKIQNIFCNHSKKSILSQITHSEKEQNLTALKMCIQEKFKNKQIQYDIPTNEIVNHPNTNIIYNCASLQHIFGQLFDTYKHIFKIKTKGTDITEIHLTSGIFKDQNIHLFADSTYGKNISIEDLLTMCETLNIPFHNQGVGSIVSEAYSILTKPVREEISNETKQKIRRQQDNLCGDCGINLKNRKYEIDHIRPLSSGGTNKRSNLQALCYDCHRKKCQQEKSENQYVFMDDTMSCFNNQVKEIFDSNLMKKWAFVETFEQCPKGQKAYTIDINKTRTNILYHSAYKWAVFSVLDEPQPFNTKKGMEEQLQCGYYYIEADKHTKYLPLRGNGWYSQPMIDYCLQQKYITKENIKYKLIPSITLDPHYFQKFIDFIRSHFPEHSKLLINAFIGGMNISEIEYSKMFFHSSILDGAYMYLTKNCSPSIMTTEQGNSIYKSCRKQMLEMDETRRPLYNQILDIEAVELDRLKSLVEQNKGTVLQCNTDSITYCKENNKKQAVHFAHWDKQKESPKYKYEPTHWLRCERLPRYERNDDYLHLQLFWTQYEDTTEMNNDSLVDTILKLERGCNIDGRAGTGKTHFCKRLIQKLRDQGKNIEVLAPTNKSAFIIGGQTYHKFFTTIKHHKHLLVNKLDYIFIDEISMVHERFYKAFQTLKKINPNLRYIMAGDFRQLPPVNDRIRNACFKESTILKELCNGNRVNLTFCRRSDKALFDLSKNTHQIKPRNFESKIGLINLCYTNKMRHFINQMCSEKYIQVKKEKNYLVLKNKQKICVGMPLIASKTVSKMDICKNEMFSVLKCSQENIQVQSECGEKKINLSLQELNKVFELAFAITCHRSQGSTFNQPYCIFEWNMYSKRMKYVAITRATQLSHINISTMKREHYE